MTARRLAYLIYWRMRRIITPKLRPAEDLWEDSLERYVAPGVNWLDAGCGHRVLGEFRLDLERRLVARCGLVIGVDGDCDAVRQHRSIRCRAVSDLGALPIANSSIDLITANMVVEHLSDPERSFREFARVLRPGGTLLIHTPNAEGYMTRLARLVPERAKKVAVWFLQRRRAEDVYPTHYKANTAPALRALAEGVGLETTRISLLCSDAGLTVLPPLAALELLWIRLLLRPSMRRHRPHVIAVFQRPAIAAEQAVVG